MSRISACGICETDQWNEFRDVSYYFDPFAIETFHRDLYGCMESLDDMIRLIGSYRRMIHVICETITARHQYCRGRCHTCGSKDGNRSPELVSSDQIVPIAEYYYGLSDSQIKVLDKLSNCLEEVEKINNMIGMKDIKIKFVNLLKFLATVDPEEIAQGNHFMNMVITGPPGHGKTEIAKLLGHAFKTSGLLTSDKFVLGTRANMIGKFCGHTAPATTKLFDEARGGVIFIDEVYALGNAEKRDVFTKECIDTINQLLSERSDTLCIIAGYEHEIETCFFSYNPGLKRRFPWRFDIQTYESQDLVAIFNKKVFDMDYETAPDALRASDIEDCKEHFANAGGDIANLITSCTLAHYDNEFLRGKSKIISRQDVLVGLKKYLSNKKVKKNEPPPYGMYV